MKLKIEFSIINEEQRIVDFCNIEKLRSYKEIEFWNYTYCCWIFVLAQKDNIIKFAQLLSRTEFKSTLSSLIF